MWEYIGQVPEEGPAGPVPKTLTSPVSQALLYDYPEAFFAPRTHTVPRPPPEERTLLNLAEALMAAERPMIISGGGVVYSEAEQALSALADATGIPVAETQAGKTRTKSTRKAAA